MTVKIFNDSAMLRLPDVLQPLGISRATAYSWLKKGQFPRPVKLSPRIAVWSGCELNDWLQKRAEGAK